MRHLAIILDGNRRYAKKHHKPTHWGHQKGADLVEGLLSWGVDLKIPIITVYALSTRNLERAGIDYLFRLLEEKLVKASKDERVHKNHVRIRCIGRISGLPPRLKAAIRKVEDATANYRRYQFNIAVAYDGKDEIVDSVRTLAEKVKSGKLDPSAISGSMIEKNLYFDVPPDLIIRTGDEQRLSGFLLWGSSYSEFYFSPKMWPEFTKKDLVKAIHEFEKRDRRFGL